MKNSKSKTIVRLSVRIKNGGFSFSPSAYSKYGSGLNYNLDACREHIKELRQHKYDGKLIYADSVFEIVKTCTTETVVKTIA